MQEKKNKRKIGGWMEDEKHEFCAWHRLVIIRYKETSSREVPSILSAEGKRECEDNEKSRGRKKYEVREEIFGVAS